MRASSRRPIGIGTLRNRTSSWLAPTKDERRLREVGETAVRRRTPAGRHLRPLLLLGRGDFGHVAGSSVRRSRSGIFLHGQLLCLDDRRGGGRPKRLG